MVRRVLIKGYRRSGFRKDVIPGRGRKIGYIRPTKVKGHFRKDTGEPGKTPESKKWFQPGGNLHGWSKEQTIAERRRKASIGRDDLSSGRALQQLSNLTTNRATKKAARADAKYFFEKHRAVRKR